MYPIDDDERFGCCKVCQYRQTEECDQCNDADLFEVDQEAAEELEEFA